jgi:hypothetical protein
MHNTVIWALQFFFSTSHNYKKKKKIIERKKLLNIKCVFIFSRTSAQNISHSKRNAAKYDQMYVMIFTCTHHLLDFNETWTVSKDIPPPPPTKKTRIPNLMKIRPVGSQVVQRRRTHVTKPTVAFHNFTNTPNKWMPVPQYRDYTTLH